MGNIAVQQALEFEPAFNASNVQVGQVIEERLGGTKIRIFRIKENAIFGVDIDCHLTHSQRCFGGTDKRIVSYKNIKRIISNV